MTITETLTGRVELRHIVFGLIVPFVAVCQPLRLEADTDAPETEIRTRYYMRTVRLSDLAQLRSHIVTLI